jgi:hypothetical protein
MLNLARLISGTNNTETLGAAIELGHALVSRDADTAINVVLRDGGWGGWLLLSKAPVDPSLANWKSIVEKVPQILSYTLYEISLRNRRNIWISYGDVKLTNLITIIVKALPEYFVRALELATLAAECMQCR